MLIQRIEVEEGFLNGLDLTFKSGLNVLIGPRGCGKTSIIELIRFCLAVPSVTDTANATARKHALSILGGGRVIVTLLVDGAPLVVTRTAQDAAPRASALATYKAPVILSQNEIESIGLDASGRLRLLDGFRTNPATVSDREVALRTQIRSLTLEARRLSIETTSLREEINQLSATLAELPQVEAQEAALASTMTALSTDRSRLSALSEALAQLSVRHQVFERTAESLAHWRDLVDGVQRPPVPVEPWPDTGGPTDPLGEVRSATSNAEARLRDALAALDLSLAKLQTLRAQDSATRTTLDDEARVLRRKLEEAQQGAGAVSRRLAELREVQSQIAAKQGLLASRLAALQDLIARRDSSLDALDTTREQRFSEREAVAAALNKALGPRIKASVERFGLPLAFSGAIASALRGSGLHYNTLGPQLAAKMSPRELATAVEEDDPTLLTSVADLPADRAVKLLSTLREAGVEDILTTDLDDGVRLSLLDGLEYKSTETLSTGQRCTVVLPILLRHSERPLIVDQPEDHLDNAFIVDTVLSAILQRGENSQLIFSTHNPNIPVLGGADWVVFLGSDGQRGFRRHAGALEDPATVDAITSVMEGGKDAFRQRAAFYNRSTP